MTTPVPAYAGYLTSEEPPRTSSRRPQRVKFGLGEFGGSEGLIVAIRPYAYGVSDQGSTLPADPEGSTNLRIHQVVYALGTSTVRVGVVVPLCRWDWLVADTWRRATTVDFVGDLRTAFEGTSFVEVAYDNLTANPFSASRTRMDELRALAPALSLREWAEGFGVSKQAISNWISSDPRERPELTDALAAFHLAATRHSDLSTWLRTELPGSTQTPLALMRTGRWKAFRAATRLKAPIGPAVSPSPSLREDARKRRAISKAVAGGDAPPAPDDVG